MMTIEPRTYVYIKRKVLRLTGVDLDCYKTPQVQRRLRTYLVKSGQPTWHRFFQVVEQDAEALSRFKDYLTINVSSFFRDVEKFEYLRERILPELLIGHPSLRVWSAGCSHGHEPYTLAILLAEATGFYRRHQILATDIDRSALERGEAGGPYGADEVEKVPAVLLERYFRHHSNGGGGGGRAAFGGGDQYYLIEGIRRRLTFSHHNLLCDPFESEFDLIVCRNVVIYFTGDVKARLYRRFHDALRPGGVLFVGGTEVISKAAELGFESVGISFYRRVDG